MKFPHSGRFVGDLNGGNGMEYQGVVRWSCEIKCLRRGFLRVSKTESQTIGMVIVQKPLLLSLSQKHKREPDRYKQLGLFNKFVRYKKDVECEKK